METHKTGRATKKRLVIAGSIAVAVGLVVAILYFTGVINPDKPTQRTEADFGYANKVERSDASAKVSEMAYRQYYLGDVDGAIAVLNKALETTPASSPDLLYLLRDKGNIEMTVGRYDDAIAAYKQAVAIDPNNAVTLEGLGQAYQSAGRKDEARAEFQKQLTAAKKLGNEIQIEDATRNLQDIDA